MALVSRVYFNAVFGALGGLLGWMLFGVFGERNPGSETAWLFLTREDVNRDSLAQSWNATAAGNRYVDLGRNGVCETMASQSRNETQRSARRTMSDLKQVLIDLLCISPAIQAATDLVQNPLISPGVQPLRRQARRAGLGIGEDGGQLPPDRVGCLPAHR